MRGQISERNRRLIRTGLRTRIANLVCEAAVATSIGIVSVGPGVRHRGDHHIIAVNVNIRRSCPLPGKIYYLPSLHLRAPRGERDA